MAVGSIPKLRREKAFPNSYGPGILLDSKRDGRILQTLDTLV